MYIFERLFYGEWLINTRPNLQEYAMQSSNSIQKFNSLNEYIEIWSS